MSALLAFACQREPKTVTTSRGTFTVPGPARIAGGPATFGFTMVTTQSGICESSSPGQSVNLDRVRTKDGRTSFYIDGMHGCPPGWVDERDVVPATPGATQPRSIGARPR